MKTKNLEVVVVFFGEKKPKRWVFGVLSLPGIPKKLLVYGILIILTPQKIYLKKHLEKTP